MTELSTIAARIKAERKKRGLSQPSLAGLAGVVKRTIVYAESGTRDISVTTLMKICQALNIPSSTILDNDRCDIPDAAGDQGAAHAGPEGFAGTGA